MQFSSLPIKCRLLFQASGAAEIEEQHCKENVRKTVKDGCPRETEIPRNVQMSKYTVREDINCCFSCHNSPTLVVAGSDQV